MNGQYSIGDTVLGTWQIKRLIGEGAYGKVYEIEREDFGSVYKAALKIVSIPYSKTDIEAAISDGMDNESVTAYFKSFVEEIVAEFALMSKLKGTANIVSYEDHQVIPHTDGIGWDVLIRMELLTSLTAYMKDHKFTVGDVIKLGTDIANALELCQKHRIIHRDVKPENIFISENGDYKLGDFGISRTADKTMSGMSKKGTYTYMAPEVYKGEAYGASVDTYSLGIVLYRILNESRTPFLPPFPAPIKYSDRENALSRRVAGEILPDPKNGSEQLKKIVLTACSYEPAKRYSNPAELKSALETVRKQTDLSAVLLADPVDRKEISRSVTSSTASTDIISEDKRESTAGPFAEREDGTVSLFDKSNEGGVSLIDEREESTVSLFDEREEGTVSLFDESEEGTVSLFDENRNNTTGLLNNSREEMPFITEEIVAHKPELKKSSSKKNRMIAAAAAALLILTAVLLATGLHKPAADGTIQSAAEPAPETQNGTRAGAGEWSEWTVELPYGVNSKDYIVEAKTQYRSVTVYPSNDANSMNKDYTLCYTRYGGYSDWSAWQNEQIGSSDIRQVETKTQYAYQMLLSKKTANEFYTATKTSYYWSQWMYSDNPVAPSSTVRVNAVQQYRFRERTMTYFFCKNSDLGAFSDTPLSPSDTVAVNTRPMYRYIIRTNGKDDAVASMDNFPKKTDDYTGRFMDVDDNQWYGGHNSGCIGTAVALGALSADAYMAFRPDENLTVAEAIKAGVVINRLYYGVQGVLIETDVWYQVYVDYAIESKMISKDDFADYTANATRAQTAYILLRALPWTELASVNIVTSITDMEINSPYYKSVYLLAQAGIISWPSPEFSFKPDVLITRAETAAFVDRLVKPQNRIVNG